MHSNDDAFCVDIAANVTMSSWNYYTADNCAAWEVCEPQCLCAVGMMENRQGDCVPLDQCECRDDQGMIRNSTYTYQNRDMCIMWQAVLACFNDECMVLK